MELELILSREKDTESNLNAFQKEIKKFMLLQLDNEEALRNVLNRLIDLIEISTDGEITIHYNFKNPMMKGA